MISADTNVRAAIADRAVRQTYHEHDGKVLINTYQDVEPHLEYAAKLRRAEWESRGQFGKRGEFRQTMSLPFNIIQATAQRLGIPASQIFDKESNKRIMRELKRPEFKYFRTTSDKRI